MNLQKKRIIIYICLFILSLEIVDYLRKEYLRRNHYGRTITMNLSPLSPDKNFGGLFVSRGEKFVYLFFDYGEAPAICATGEERFLLTEKKRFLLTNEEGYEFGLNTLNFIRNGKIYLIKQYKVNFKQSEEIYLRDFFDFVKKNNLYIKKQPS